VRFPRHLRILFLLLLCSTCFAQSPTVISPSDINSPAPDADEARARMAHEMEKKAAKERVAALKNDTDKLLKLSTELKSYVDKSDENVLSIDVIKKAEQIEKLAKSVKDKMKGPN
jgi:5'-deoxynucleotidase YfbR-like HD superfamily hydrolase